MILDGTKMRFRLFHDSRGECGESGQLLIGEDKKGSKYLVKEKCGDVTNEYVAHKLAKLMDVPTSDAVLIKYNNSLAVGIQYEDSLKRVYMDDFISLNEKFPDDSPYLADLMKYLAFRTLILLDDNPQLGIVDDRLISFDYADSFHMTEFSFWIMISDNDISRPLYNIEDSIRISDSYKSYLSILKRQDTDFLRKVFNEPVRRMKEADITSILDDLDRLYPTVVSQFYAGFIEIIKKSIESYFLEE